MTGDSERKDEISQSLHSKNWYFSYNILSKIPATRKKNVEINQVTATKIQ